MNKIRYCITTYLKHIYRTKQIGGDPLQLNTIDIDESLFLHDNSGAQIWVVGEIDTESKEIRLDIIKERNF